MRMDENVNPEWKRQCRSSSSGRKALAEIERLTARHNGDVKVVQATEACARKHQAENTRLREAIITALADIRELKALQGG